MSEAIGETGSRLSDSEFETGYTFTVVPPRSSVNCVDQLSGQRTGDDTRRKKGPSGCS